MTIETPEFCGLDVYLTFKANIPRDKLEIAHDILWRDLGEPTANILLMYWRGFLSYQISKSLVPGKSDKSAPLTPEIINTAVQEYKTNPDMLSTWVHRERGIQIWIGEQLSGPSEVVMETAMETDDTLCVTHLVAMLAYAQNFPNQLEVNPLLPLVWWWAKADSIKPRSRKTKTGHGMAINGFINRLVNFLYPRKSNNDNMFFTLPPIQAQGLEGVESRAPTRCEVKLSEGLP